MKSGKQRRQEIMAKRQARMQLYAGAEAWTLPPPGAVIADHGRLGHNNTYDPFPLFYVDRGFVCRDCGADQVWTAKQQKWWYEVMQGNIHSTAIRCRPCRKKEQARKAEARRAYSDGLEKKERNKVFGECR